MANFELDYVRSTDQVKKVFMVYNLKDPTKTASKNKKKGNIRPKELDMESLKNTPLQTFVLHSKRKELLDFSQY